MMCALLSKILLRGVRIFFVNLRLKSIMMKHIFAIILAAVMAFSANGLRAQEPDIVSRINSSGTITVEQPEGMAARLHKTESASSDNQEERAQHVARGGYRIQVFDDNDPRTARAEAQNRKALIASHFPEYRCYVQFNSPYWRVKAGDFRSRSEAEGALEEMRRALPHLSGQMRIVRDRINND